MARKKKSSPSQSGNLSSFPIGNCEVLIEGAPKSFNCEQSHDSLSISASKNTKIKITVLEDVNINEEIGGKGEKVESSSCVDCRFEVVNPKDADTRTKSLLQEILSLYMKELPAMSFAANTGKPSLFLERCVSNGKFSTLVLCQKSSGELDKVIASITYQIIPTDTQYAEIPLAVVRSSYHRKGVGRLLYTELRRRFRDVGISTILCWGDKESQGFWHKQGFVTVAEVDTKGRARRFPIRADIRRALCFPGGSTLMVSHLNDNLHDIKLYPIKLHLESAPSTSSIDEFYSVAGTSEAFAPASAAKCNQENLPVEQNESLSEQIHHQLSQEKLDTNTVGDSVSTKGVANQISSTYQRNRKRSVWETSSSSFNSKRVKAAHVADQSHSESMMVLDTEDREDFPIDGISLGLEDNMLTAKRRAVDSRMVGTESEAREKRFNIMLMDISDGPKKAYLTKIVEDLGGAVTTDGSRCTHVLAIKVRTTLNFCTALCSGAWILTPHWLKESSRKCGFVDEIPYLLKDEDYLTKFRVDLKDAVLRARRNPGALLKGYNICLTRHIHPPIQTLSTIVRSAGGDVIIGSAENHEKSRTICVTCGEDMEEALLAVKSGIRTFSSEWLINCIMKQELDLDAPQFAESL